jgi:hypothetical protein
MVNKINTTELSLDELEKVSGGGEVEGQLATWAVNTLGGPLGVAGSTIGNLIYIAKTIHEKLV